MPTSMPVPLSAPCLGTHAHPRASDDDGIRPRAALKRWQRRVALLALVLASPAFALDLLVSSRFSDNVLRFDGDTGEFKSVFASGNGLDNPNGIAYGLDGNLYVGLGDVGRVMVFQGRTGEFLRDFVTPASSGGLAGCRGIAFLPDGDLLVTSGANDQVLRYEKDTGAFKGVFASGRGLDGPVGLAVGPDGHVYVGAALSNAVFHYDGLGTLLQTLPSPAGDSNATGVLIEREGRLLVAESVSNVVRRIDPDTGVGATFASGGGLAIPIGMILHPDGDLLVGSFDNDKVIRYDGNTGALKGDFIASGAGGLNGTHNFAFMPDAGATIRGGHSGAWYNPTTSGQGFLFDVRESDRFFFVAWFNYAAAPATTTSAKVGSADQRWLTIQGTYGGSRLRAPIFSTSGGAFAVGRPVTSAQVGIATLTFLSCSRATLEFTLLQEDLTGVIPLQRLLPGTEAPCVAQSVATNP